MTAFQLLVLDLEFGLIDTQVLNQLARAHFIPCKEFLGEIEASLRQGRQGTALEFIGGEIRGLADRCRLIMTGMARIHGS